MRLTKKRQLILDTLKTSKEAMTAKQLHAVLPEVDLVTIYRALDAFVAENMIARLTFGETEALFEYQSEPHHHAVCTDCDRVIHFSVKDSDLKKLLPLENFDISGVDLTIKGSCR